MRALLLTLSLVGFARAATIPCTTVNSGTQCVISAPVVLSAGDNTCCDGVGSLTDLQLQPGASLTCPIGTPCSVTITLSSGGFTTQPGSPAPSINITGAFTVAKAAPVTLQGASIFATFISVTATSDDLQCGQSTLNTSATSTACAPVIPGTSKLGAVVGLGAPKAGAGATGYDASPAALAAAGATYTGSMFTLDQATPSALKGCQGGAGVQSYPCTNCADPIRGSGGGAVVLVAQAGELALDACLISADGGYGSRSGGGSGGSVVLVASGAISVGDASGKSSISARGGNSVSLASDYPCKNYPCGMPGGGGYVFAKSGAVGSKALADWGSGTSAAGGKWTGTTSGPVCGGGGLLVDCQASASNATGCVVTVSGDAACAGSAIAASVACNDSPAYGPGPCLLPPTPLNCEGPNDLVCSQLDLLEGVNVSLAGPLAVAGPLTATSAVFSSALASTVISSDGDMMLQDVSFVSPPGGATRNLTVFTIPPADLTWSVGAVKADLSITGSLTVSAGRNLALDFNDVHVAAPAAKTADASCSAATWEGALLGYAETGDLTFGGNGVNVGSLLLYSYNDFALKGCSVVARGCVGGKGAGAGGLTNLSSQAATPLYVGGGASHSSAGSPGSAAPAGPDPAAGVPYDTSPLSDSQLYGGSGGGGGAGVGGWGGGTVLLAGNGTVSHAGPASKFDVSGGAGASNFAAGNGTGGGGSGGMFVIVLNSYDESKSAESGAMHSIQVNARGGMGGFLSDAPETGDYLCGGSGGGGTVLIAAPLAGKPALPPSKAPVISASGGPAPTSVCSPGAAGTVVYTNLPTPPSVSRTPTVSNTPSITASGSPSSSQTPSVTPSVTVTPSGSDTVSPTPTGSDSVTPSMTPSPSGTLTQTPSNTATRSASPTYVPAPPAATYGLPTATFYAAVGGGAGLVFIALACGVARACRKPDEMLSLNGGGGGGGGGPAGSLWSDAYAEKQSLLRTPTDDRQATSGYLRSGGSFYVPPSGVV
jgi:hypothetical protein